VVDARLTATMSAESRTAVAAALLGNAALALLKGVAATVTGSASMLAETFHSVADTGNQVLLVLGMRLARRPPDDRHPFGHGHDVYVWAFVVSMMLFSVGGGFSIWEGVRHYLHPRETQSLAWAYVVLAGAAVFELISLHGRSRAWSNRTARSGGSGACAPCTSDRTRCSSSCRSNWYPT
jgi:cation diffusion facilitator family transporter